jgi:hypothetical protein
MTELIEISDELAPEAWDVWLRIHFGLDCEEVADRFFKFCEGDKYPDHDINFDPWGYNEDVWGYNENDGSQFVTPAVYERLQQLLSPHAETIVRAWYKAHPELMND